MKFATSLILLLIIVQLDGCLGKPGRQCSGRLQATRRECVNDWMILDGAPGKMHIIFGAAGTHINTLSPFAITFTTGASKIAVTVKADAFSPLQLGRIIHSESSQMILTVELGQVAISVALALLLPNTVNDWERRIAVIADRLESRFGLEPGAMHAALHPPVQLYAPDRRLVFSSSSARLSEVSHYIHH